MADDPAAAAHDVLAAEEFGVPAPDPKLASTEAHDVLAAEEFGVPAPDAGLTDREARDVLAAEEFGLPAPDPVLQIVGQPLALPTDPNDPSGAEPARDVLAAEEFGVPGTAERAVPPGYRAQPKSGRGRGLAALGVGGVTLAAVLRRRRRRQAA